LIKIICFANLSAFAKIIDKLLLLPDSYKSRRKRVWASLSSGL